MTNNKLLVFIICYMFMSPVLAFNVKEKTSVTIYEKINPAIVSVDSRLSDGLSCGTGCIIDKNGTILTSAHILEEGNDIIVTTSNGQDYQAKVLKKLGEHKDIALLKISPIYELSTVKMGDSSKIKVGEKVLAIGNPFGFKGTLTQGIVSRIDYEKNPNGEIIGINQAIYNPDNNISNIGIGFATPVNLIKEYLLDN